MLWMLQTHAEYNDEAEYIAHQAVQAYDIAQFIRISSEDVDLAILAVDLNMEPEKLCYRIIKSYAQLEDSFKVNLKFWNETSRQRRHEGGASGAYALGFILREPLAWSSQRMIFSYFQKENSKSCVL